MKTLIFLIIAFAATGALAHDNESGGCEVLKAMYTHTTQKQKISSLTQASDLEQAYQTLCREQHQAGEAVYYPNGKLAVRAFNTDDSSLYYPNSSVMMEYNSDGDPVWYYPNGEIASDNPDLLWNILNGSERKVAKIEALFKNQHKACAGSCTYVSWGIWGDEAHKKRRSCHNSGEAIDIHAIRCGKATSGPKSAKFKTYVKCMKKKFTVLFEVKDHYQHAHIQIPKCRMIKLK